MASNACPVMSWKAADWYVRDWEVRTPLMNGWRDRSGGSPSGAKLRWGSPGGGGVHVALQSSSRRSDSGIYVVWVAVRVAWNVASTASVKHSSARVLIQRFKYQWPVMKERGLVSSKVSIE